MKENRFFNYQKKLENFRNKFSKKQIHTITIIFILMWLLMVLYFPKIPNSYFPFPKTFLFFAGVLFIYVIVEIVLFDLDGRDVKELEEEIALIVPEEFHLVKGEFVEVLLSPHLFHYNIAINLGIETLNELDVKFYAKLTEEQKITIIKKDKDNNIIGKPLEISNFTFFENNFKPKN